MVQLKTKPCWIPILKYWSMLLQPPRLVFIVAATECGVHCFKVILPLHKVAFSPYISLKRKNSEWLHFLINPYNISFFNIIVKKITRKKFFHKKVDQKTKVWNLLIFMIFSRSLAWHINSTTDILILKIITNIPSYWIISIFRSQTILQAK